MRFLKSLNSQNVWSCSFYISQSLAQGRGSLSHTKTPEELGELFSLLDSGYPDFHPLWPCDRCARSNCPALSNRNKVRTVPAQLQAS